VKNIDFSKNNFLVVGSTGATGSSVVNYLNHKHVANSNLVSLKSHNELNDSHIEFADVIIISPGVLYNLPILNHAKAQGKLVIGDIELFAREVILWQQNHNTKIIGITGSNGKTTCASLTAYLSSGLGYRTELAGNIGVPVLDIFLKYARNPQEPIPQVVVLELSSYQLEATYNLHLDAATVLNISEDHLDHGITETGYGYSMLEYASAKARIFENAKVCVLNANDDRVCDMYKAGMKAVWFFNAAISVSTVLRDNDVIYNNVVDHDILVKNTNDYQSMVDIGKISKFSDPKLLGVHNLSNIIASLVLLNETLEIIKDDGNLLERLIAAFEPLPHRINIYEAKNHQLQQRIFFIDDSKATNIDATRVALDTCSDRFGDKKYQHSCHLILGGDAKGQNLRQLALLVDQYVGMIASIHIIGKDRDIIFTILTREICFDHLRNFINIYETLAQAIDSINTKLQQDSDNGVLTSTVLLAPACASLDQYTGYAQRGEDFINNAHKFYQLERWK